MCADVIEKWKYEKEEWGAAGGVQMNEVTLRQGGAREGMGEGGGQLESAVPDKIHKGELRRRDEAGNNDKMMEGDEEGGGRGTDCRGVPPV